MFFGIKGDFHSKSFADLFFDIFQCLAFAGSKKAKIPDFDEAFGQYVLKKPAQELEGIQGTPMIGVIGAILVSECYFSVFDREDVPIRNGHPIDIGCQVAEHCFAVAHRFDVADPLLAPYVSRDLFKEVVFFEQFHKFSSNESGQGLYVHQEIRFGILPLAFSDSSSGDQKVNMRMVNQLPGPGLQDAHHTKFCTQEPFILCQEQYRFGRCLEEQMIQGFLVATEDGS